MNQPTPYNDPNDTANFEQPSSSHPETKTPPAFETLLEQMHGKSADEQLFLLRQHQRARWLRDEPTYAEEYVSEVLGV